ncbi:Holliday junction resolvase YqgF [Acidimicrobium ferrooxidans DSM 10331]|uniref:Putative pre-16S rRNA nuclease n=1 Tax=Acidimicrobium ferrooxidans (strain DSM 10331 / JCM 15462 / NBRC 103882 / ICP) TaxID=525909 RepID=C7LYT3_ACIFD|nr:Holliday junction resolvase RuvX [Acidimicrobium ferrooxidans]ACU53891.1 Holliday junction resolvase YqgF [Acidimicrobium ferrooxidans DSM 10331]
MSEGFGGRALGVDLGTKRIGVAVAEGSLALPLEVIDARGPWRARLAELVASVGASVVVVGLPIGLDGSEGRAAARVRQWSEGLAEHLEVPVVFVDERLSSQAAERRLGAAGVDARSRRGAVDAFAATEILERWLVTQR